MKTPAFLALLVPALSLACGSRAVDLDGEHAPKFTASNDPGVVALVDEAVINLAVDDERLYWVGSWYDENAKIARGALRSCKKTNCAAPLITYEPLHAAAFTGFFVRADEVFWLQKEEDDKHSTLHACSIAGCDHGAREVSSFVLEDAEVMTLAADAAFVSVTSFQGVEIASAAVYRFSLGPGDNAPTLVVRPSQEVVSFAVHDDYLYWLEQPGLGSVNTPDYFSRQALQRTLADGSGSPQLLANNLLLEGLNQQRLVVDQGYAYWTESELYGSINRCPLTGCTDPSTPEAFLQPILTPTTLWLDAGNLYWAHDTADAGYAMSVCRLSDCTPADAGVAGLSESDVMAFDDAFIYAVDPEQVTSVSDGGVSVQRSAFDAPTPIRRFPKVAP